MREKERAIGLLIVVVDQVSKFLTLRSGVAVINQGVAFGILLYRYLAILLIGFYFLILLLFLRKRHFGSLFILAGGSSNLLDRLFYGGVVDFIQLPLIPAFNLADLAIVLGCVLLLIDLLFHKRVYSSY